VEFAAFDDAYFVGWGTLALINANLAQAKHRSGLGWLLLSLLFGPVATFALLFFDPLPEGDDTAYDTGVRWGRRARGLEGSRRP
jgi:hypothetical protein